MSLFNKILEFIIYYFLLGLMWVGAEYVFEGAVHTSAVDSVVCAAMARLIQKYNEVEV